MGKIIAKGSIEIRTAFEYEERIVAFIDILGFRSLVNGTIDRETSEVDNDKLKILGDSLMLIKRGFKDSLEDLQKSSDFQITYFSDSIVVSFPSSVENLSIVFKTLKGIQIELIEKGILLRGGIVQGKVIHTPEMILGPAMINAYDLESKSALYPRITIDPEIIHQHFSEDSLNVNDLKTAIKIDFDNTFYIDYFKSSSNPSLEDEKRYYSNLRKLIRSGVKRADIGLRMKYLWMLNKFNISIPTSIRKMRYNGDDEIKNELKFRESHPV